MYWLLRVLYGQNKGTQSFEKRRMKEKNSITCNAYRST